MNGHVSKFTPRSGCAMLREIAEKKRGLKRAVHE